MGSQSGSEAVAHWHASRRASKSDIGPAVTNSAELSVL